jgi:hypothetical protein
MSASNGPFWLLTAALVASAGCLGTECVELSRREAFRAATVVFRGVVVRVEDPNEPGEAVDPATHELRLQPADSAGLRVVTFRVRTAWKGPVTETMRILAFGRPSIGQGYVFRVGAEYVVYGDRAESPTAITKLSVAVGRLSEGTPVFGIGMPCPLRIRTDTEEESRRLGKGRLPSPDHPRATRTR